MATELKLHAIKCLHLKQVMAPPEVTGWRRRLTKGFHHNDDGNQKYPLACPAFKEWDMMKAMQETCCSIWDAGWKGIYHPHIEHILHKVGGDRHGERVDRIEDSCHDPQCSGACQTYFPRPRTRHVDPRSILAEQRTMLDEPTKVGMRNTDAHACVPSLFSSQCIYIYPTSTRN